MFHTESDGGEPTIVLPEEIKLVIDTALSAGHPVAVAHVAVTGEPHLAVRGTVQVFSDNQLALWTRDPGLPSSIVVNPRIALLYVDLTQRTQLRFAGRAHIATDEAIRDQVFERSPQSEQAQDLNRRGTAILIDLDLVRGITPSGPVNMGR